MRIEVIGALKETFQSQLKLVTYVILRSFFRAHALPETINLNGTVEHICGNTPLKPQHKHHLNYRTKLNQTCDPNKFLNKRKMQHHLTSLLSMSFDYIPRKKHGESHSLEVLKPPQPLACFGKKKRIQ